MCIPLYVGRLVPLFFSRGNSDGSFVTNLLKNIYSSNAKGLENDLYQWYTGVTRETSIRGWDSYVNRGSMRNAVTRVNQKWVVVLVLLRVPFFSTTLCTWIFPFTVICGSWPLRGYSRVEPTSVFPREGGRKLGQATVREIVFQVCPYKTVYTEKIVCTPLSFCFSFRQFFFFDRTLNEP